MSSNLARKRSASVRQFKHSLLGGVCVIALGLALALGTSPATAKSGKYRSSRGEAEHVNKDKDKNPFGEIPKGPLQIFISIDQQKLHLYSDGVLVTETLVATGVPGHPTPMGVFSVIEKDRYHHSNIYSGAPMPFMQRITWSGVAMHEGTGVGHVASHGCIRMPHDFAARLWVLTKLGVRVVIARPELRPTDFADAHLFVHRETNPTAALPEPVRTAQTIDTSKASDAGDVLVQAPATAPQTAESPAPAEPTPPAAAEATQPSTPAEPAITGTTATEPAKPALADELRPSTPAEPTQPAATNSTPEPAAPATAETPSPEPAKPAVVETPQPSTPAAASAPLTSPAPIVAPVIAVPEFVPMPLPKPAKLLEIAAEAHGPIAIFVSRKEKKIFVRQHFTPLFEAPITISHLEQPIGTHVFTAMEYVDKGSTALRWNVVTLPAEQPRASRSERESRYEGYGRGRHRQDAEVKIEVPAAPVNPQDALARIQIPQDVIDQISALIVPGSSLVISDQGLGGETGHGTDFIVVTR